MSGGLKTLGHTTINGQPVRLYASPLPGPDYPWHVMDDLMASLGAPDWWRQTALDRFVTTWPEHCRTVPDEGGQIVISSSFCGLGLLDWIAEESGRLVEAEREAFVDAVSLGFAEQMAHLPPSEMEAACQVAAARHSQGAGSA